MGTMILLVLSEEKGSVERVKMQQAPDDCRPPGAQPRGDQRHTPAEFVEFGGGARITPGLFRQNRLQEKLANCGPLQSSSSLGTKKAGPTALPYSMR